MKFLQPVFFEVWGSFWKIASQFSKNYPFIILRGPRSATSLYDEPAIVRRSHKNTIQLFGRTLLAACLAGFILLSACTPARAPAVSSGDGIVHAVMFYTPGCSSCEKALSEIIPPLQARYGSRFQLLEVPLNDVSEVNRLYDAADFFQIKKEDVMVPFLVIGNDLLIGDTALEENLDVKIKAGIVSGGLAQPDLPPPLAELAARPTPTPRATLAPLISLPGVEAQPTTCVINTPCAPTVTP